MRRVRPSKKFLVCLTLSTRKNYHSYRISVKSTIVCGTKNIRIFLAKQQSLFQYAKHKSNMRALIRYEEVPTKIWSIAEMTEFWGINVRTVARLNKLGIYSNGGTTCCTTEEGEEKATNFSLYVGFSMVDYQKSISVSRKLRQPALPKTHRLLLLNSLMSTMRVVQYVILVSVPTTLLRSLISLFHSLTVTKLAKKPSIKRKRKPCKRP